ncbi:hypothetical protein CAOG_06111 [Capsaspora owczarzaki ATCC 30864]|uniref:Uncharacterized protein n=1 Tax=Capsaspora owczarzaki (strain ATCC 30864) TaxID=595528 RepID=A0A0D2WTD5_CAPO3|nr:hypothetical protein CAOG_06111 [Capsaspora owczarzaki ATCC 30864]KJE95685.1 hypothetical protein CAOG_006111 [Capsaspora owczarzaki ATCC 30864]|eukprot:XP_004345701.1 hypothetical protein CAOG_06111 [Capsaspora owczarzaki ATCC 30864]
MDDSGVDGLSMALACESAMVSLFDESVAVKKTLLAQRRRLDTLASINARHRNAPGLVDAETASRAIRGEANVRAGVLALQQRLAFGVCLLLQFQDRARILQKLVADESQQVGTSPLAKLAQAFRMAASGSTHHQSAPVAAGALEPIPTPQRGSASETLGILPSSNSQVSTISASASISATQLSGVPQQQQLVEAVPLNDWKQRTLALLSEAKVQQHVTAAQQARVVNELVDEVNRLALLQLQSGLSELQRTDSTSLDDDDDI